MSPNSERDFGIPFESPSLSLSLCECECHLVVAILHSTFNLFTCSAFVWQSMFGWQPNIDWTKRRKKKKSNRFSVGDFNEMWQHIGPANLVSFGKRWRRVHWIVRLWAILEFRLHSKRCGSSDFKFVTRSGAGSKVPSKCLFHFGYLHTNFHYHLQPLLWCSLLQIIIFRWGISVALNSCVCILCNKSAFFFLFYLIRHFMFVINLLTRTHSKREKEPIALYEFIKKQQSSTNNRSLFELQMFLLWFSIWLFTQWPVAYFRLARVHPPIATKQLFWTGNCWARIFNMIFFVRSIVNAQMFDCSMPNVDDVRRAVNDV